MQEHDLGCAAGAKGGTNFTYWPLLRGGCRAGQTHECEIQLTATGLANGVLYHEKMASSDKELKLLLWL